MNRLLKKEKSPLAGVTAATGLLCWGLRGPPGGDGCSQSWVEAAALEVAFHVLSRGHLHSLVPGPQSFIDFERTQ